MYILNIYLRIYAILIYSFIVCSCCNIRPCNTLGEVDEIYFLISDENSHPVPGVSSILLLNNGDTLLKCSSDYNGTLLLSLGKGMRNQTQLILFCHPEYYCSAVNISSINGFNEYPVKLAEYYNGELWESLDSERFAEIEIRSTYNNIAVPAVDVSSYNIDGSIESIGITDYFGKLEIDIDALADSIYLIFTDEIHYSSAVFVEDVIDGRASTIRLVPM